MTDETTRPGRLALLRSARHSMALTAVAAVAVLGALAATSPATAETAPAPRDSGVATFATEIQWGGPTADWHADADLVIYVSNRHTIAGKGAPAAGTQMSWSGPNGNANITFFDNGTFSGSAQFPNEGPVGYRGKLK